MSKAQSLKSVLSIYRFVWIGIGLGLLFWFLESIIHVVVFQEGPLTAQILSKDPHEIWKRLLVAGLLIAFSVFVQQSVNRRRRSEAALAERECELSLILENNPAGIMLVDAASRVVSWVNTNALKLLDSSKDVVEGQICHNHLCPAEKGSCPILDLGKTMDLSERVLLTPGGIRLPILKSVTRVKYNGRDHLLEAFFDISDRKKMERDLRQAHAELDQIFQTASVAMRLVDRDFNVLKINRTFEQLTGVTEREAVEKKCHEVFSGPTCFTEECPLTRILNGKEAVECYMDKHQPDGENIPCILTATPFIGSDGNIVGIVESFRDISELRRAHDAIETERDKLKRILAHFVEGVCIINEDFMLEYQNTILTDYFGNCEDKPCYAAFHDRAAPCEPCLMQTATRTGKNQHADFETSEERSFEKVYTPITDIDNQQKVVLLMRDVTEKKASTAAIMRAEQLAALGEMAAGVAHEINNPINGIINYAQVQINKSEEGSVVHDIAGRMIEEGHRIARIVEGLLFFARQKHEARRRVSVSKILNDSMALIAAQTRKDNIHLKIDIPDDLPDIFAQAHEIEQVFVNIISNARYALNQKYQHPHEDKILKISAETVKPNGNLIVRVCFYDHGTGIPSNIIDKVMNPFFTSKTEGKRTGLGLSISHGIMEDHGGRLIIQSEEGRYTRVNVEFPVHIEADK